MVRKLLFGLGCVFLILGLTTGWAGAQKLGLYMGSTQSTSSYYANSLTWAKVINKYAPDVHVTVVESGATFDNLDRTRTGEFQLSMPSAYSGVIQSYYGLERYKGKPDKTLRMICITNPVAVFHLVRKDSGITDIKGLDGKKYFPGPIGHIARVANQKTFEKFGIHGQWFVGGFADAVTATQDNRIVGFSKTGAGSQLDASMLQVISFVPCRLLSWTQEMVDYTMKIVPGAVDVTIPKGKIEAMPAEGPIRTWGDLLIFFTTKNLPPDAVYNILKAVEEHWKSDIAPNFAPCREVDLLKDSLKSLSAPDQAVPLHIGAVRYYQEKGFKVPQKLMPPEK
jgi:TRAP transporter TAXI family solute receptor